MGLKLNDNKNINDLLFTDDQVIIYEDGKDTAQKLKKTVYVCFIKPCKNGDEVRWKKTLFGDVINLKMCIVSSTVFQLYFSYIFNSIKTDLETLFKVQKNLQYCFAINSIFQRNFNAAKMVRKKKKKTDIFIILIRK